jgi:hypothetical protein
VQRKPGEPVIALDADLAVVGAKLSKAWGQVAASADGSRVAVATIAGVDLLDEKGKRDAKVDTVEWWEHTSGGVAFADGAKRAWLTCIPDDEEDETDAKAAVCVLDVEKKKRIGFTPIDFDHESHLWLYPRSDGRSAILWANAQQDAQAYWLVTGIDGDPKVAPLRALSGKAFTEQIDASDALLVTSFRSIAWHASKDGKKVREISFDAALGDGEDIVTAVPAPNDETLLLVDCFAKKTSRLALGAKDGTMRTLDMPGLPDARPCVLQSGPSGAVLVGHWDGTLALIG